MVARRSSAAFATDGVWPRPTANVRCGAHSRSCSWLSFRFRASLIHHMATTAPAIEMIGVSRVEDGQLILRDVDWAVQPDERWIVLGRNGSGKSTLLRIASLYLHPS